MITILHWVFEGVEVVILSVVYRSDEWRWDKKDNPVFSESIERAMNDLACADVGCYDGGDKNWVDRFQCCCCSPTEIEVWFIIINE